MFFPRKFVEVVKHMTYNQKDTVRASTETLSSLSDVFHGFPQSANVNF
jgi:hypothetical protein